MFIVFVILLHIYSYITLSPNDNRHAVAAEVVIAIIPIPVTDEVIELDVVAINLIVSSDFSIVVKVSFFLLLFLIYGFCL